MKEKVQWKLHFYTYMQNTKFSKNLYPEQQHTTAHHICPSTSKKKKENHESSFACITIMH